MNVIFLDRSAPWRYERGYVKGSNGYTVARVYTTLDDDGSLMDKHGRVLAAAPDLLVELRDTADAIDVVVEWMERVALPALGDDSDGGNLLCASLTMKADEIRDAIANATKEGDHA